MTKKDFIRAAELIRYADVSKRERKLLADYFVDFFKGDNPRFDAGRFTDACGLDKED